MNVEKMNKSVVVTLLIFRALVMCCAPSGLILFDWRLSVVSICVMCVNVEKMNKSVVVTLLIFRALAMC